MTRALRLEAGAERDLPALIEVLSALPDDRAWRITLEECKPVRTLQQNAYYWGVVVKAISRAIGFESQEVHEYLCGNFFGWRDKRVLATPRNPRGIESVPMRTTTTDEQGRASTLSITQFTEFLDHAIRFAAEQCHVSVPDADPRWRRAQFATRERRAYLIGYAEQLSDEQRMQRIGEIGCIACLSFLQSNQCDVHHLNLGEKAGAPRLGHRYTIGLCVWHHRGQPINNLTLDECYEELGPSLARQPVAFRKVFGNDRALLAEQDARIGELMDSALAK